MDSKCLKKNTCLYRFRGLFSIFELRVLTVIDCLKIVGANSPIFKIAGAKAPKAPVLNRLQRLIILILKSQGI